LEDSPQPYLDLVDWRRRIGDMYRLGRRSGINGFRSAKDELFREHPQSPIPAEQRAGFRRLQYFPPDPSYRVACSLDPPRPGLEAEIEIDTGGEDGVITYRRIGTLTFQLEGTDAQLTVFSIRGYGGGLFLPFRDATSGRETYGGGRYLFDTIKNTDALALEVTVGRLEVEIDFNYAYNPSCAYDVRWACPLAPRENWLAQPVRAGEMNYAGGPAAP
jgi:uncharacterized protein (DUF1684 family)